MNKEPQGTIYGPYNSNKEAFCYICGTRNVLKTDSHGRWVCRKHAELVTVPIIERTRKAGRNKLCPCGSGRKSKHCHGKRNQQAAGVVG